MPHCLPDDVVHRILIRLSALEPVPSIAAAVGVARETVYRMQRNVELWGVPYPPPTVKLGCPRLLLPYQEEVIKSII
jgi:transposase